MTDDRLLIPRLFEIDTALLTKRCVIRRFRENEGKQLYNLVRDSHDYLYDHYPDLPLRVGNNADAAESFLRQRIANWLLQREFAFGIWENETTDLIGYLQIGNLDWRVPAGELSLFFRPDRKEMGYVTETLARVIRFSFRQLQLEKINFPMLSDNYAMQRSARKVGFNREGDLRNEFRKGSGNLVDVMRFGLSRETYGE